jgi:hypothetical protein
MNYDIDVGYEFPNSRKVTTKSLIAGELTTQELIGSLSEDIAITSLDWAKKIFLNKDLATINEKRSLLEALWLYVWDTNVIEDEAVESVKTDIILASSLPVTHGLSDEDVKDAFPIIYKILFPQSE